MSTAMSTTNQTFNWKRFSNALRKELSENKVTLLLSLLAIFLYFAFTLTIDNMLSRGMKDLSLDPMIIFFFIGIFASMGFRGLLSKGKRTDYLAMPVSNAEKFTVNALIYVIGGIVAVIACIYLADLARMAILWHKRDETFLVFGLSAFANVTTKWVDTTGEFLPCLPKFLLNCLWYSSVFMLGSIVWPKRSLLKTGTVVICYFMLVFVMLTLIHINDDAELEEAISQFDKVEISIDCVVIALCWVGGWFLFKGKDVITRKWWS